MVTLLVGPVFFSLVCTLEPELMILSVNVTVHRSIFSVNGTSECFKRLSSFAQVQFTWGRRVPLWRVISGHIGERARCKGTNERVILYCPQVVVPLIFLHLRHQSPNPGRFREPYRSTYWSVLPVEGILGVLGVAQGYPRGTPWGYPEGVPSRGWGLPPHGTSGGTTFPPKSASGLYTHMVS